MVEIKNLGMFLEIIEQYAADIFSTWKEIHNITEYPTFSSERARFIKWRRGGI